MNRRIRNPRERTTLKQARSLPSTLQSQKDHQPCYTIDIKYPNIKPKKSKKKN